MTVIATINGEHELKEGDIFRWSYTDKHCPSFEPYWCKARIAVARKAGENFVLSDTYWSGSEQFTLFLNVIGERYEIEFIANFSDLKKCYPEDHTFYDKKDCVNIHHPNCGENEGYYLRKGAKKSLEKMRKVLQVNKEHFQYKVEYYKSQVEQMDELLANLNEDRYIPIEKDVWYPEEG